MGIGLTYLGISKLFFPSQEGEIDRARVEVAQGRLEVRVAQDEKTRYQGLSGVKELPEGAGMLFIHEKPGRYAYVMRGMQFDLDFIFIKGGRVVDIARRVAWDYRGEIQGATDYDKVLEVPAGWARQNEVKIGDEIEISF